jgi:hypothetical protein
MNLILYCPVSKRVGISTSPLTNEYLQKTQNGHNISHAATDVGEFEVNGDVSVSTQTVGRLSRTIRPPVLSSMATVSNQCCFLKRTVMTFKVEIVINTVSRVMSIRQTKSIPVITAQLP